MSEQPTMETHEARYQGRVGTTKTPLRWVVDAELAESLEQRLLAAQSENQRLREEGAYLKLQRDRLLEITWLDLPSEPHESTARWAEEFDKGWLRREPAEAERDGLRVENQRIKEERSLFVPNERAHQMWAEAPACQILEDGILVDAKTVALAAQQMMHKAISERDALASQVATLTAERDEIGKYLWPNQTGMPNKHRNILLAVETRERLLRTQNAALLARDAVADALATTSPGAPLIEAVRKAVEALRKCSSDIRLWSDVLADEWRNFDGQLYQAMHQSDAALAELEKFLPKV